MEPTALSAIAQVYGADFAAAIEGGEVNAWTGPVASAYGVHLIRILSREGGRVPPLEKIREAVRREWTNARAKELEAARMSALLERYDVTMAKYPPGTTT
jgi:parvulin-like peptidyl-prolyl isomerase